MSLVLNKTRSILNIQEWFSVVYTKSDSKQLDIAWNQLEYSDVFNALLVMINPHWTIADNIILVINSKKFSNTNLVYRVLSIFEDIWFYLNLEERNILELDYCVHKYQDGSVKIFCK